MITRAKGDSATVVYAGLASIEVDEPSLLDAIMADPKAAECITIRVSGTIALVEPSKFDALAKRLVKTGHLPKVM